MICHPELRIDDFVTPNTEYITVHEEASLHFNRIVQQIKSKGVKAGVAINPSTPVSALECIFEYVDLILVMSVNPGFGGQKFIPNSLDKIKQLDAIRKEKAYNYLIEIDGGVSLSNAKELTDAGVDILVAGSAVYGAEDVPARCREFKEITK